MPHIEIREYHDSGTTSYSSRHTNRAASLSLGKTRDGSPLCRLTVSLVDAAMGLDSTMTLDTADPQVVNVLLAHDWSDVDATQTLCWKLILERVLPAQFQTFCVSIAQTAWAQGRDDVRAVMRQALGFDTATTTVLTPDVVARVLAQ